VNAGCRWGRGDSLGRFPDKRPSSVTDWASRTTAYSYDDNGRLIRTTFPNGTQESRVYDLAGKLTRIQDLDPLGNVIYSSVRQMDPAGRVMGENITPAPTSFGIPDATMTFDADNRLTNFNGQAVSFDADGNMTSVPRRSRSTQSLTAMTPATGSPRPGTSPINTIPTGPGHRLAMQPRTPTVFRPPL
jgi:YD repeat-containing protein